MKKKLFASLFLFLSGIVFSVLGEEVLSKTSKKTADGICNLKASPAASKLLSYIAGVPSANPRGILVGQQTAHGENVSYGMKEYVDNLQKETGQYPSLVSADYAYGAKRTDDPDLKAINKVLIEWWKKGGLVTVSWHARNPVTGGTAFDVAKPVDLKEILKPGTEINKRWISQLDRVAKGLAELRDAKVVVLWRPFHEMNGNWFWWGRQDYQGHKDDFNALWRQMFDYFTKDKKLDNLIWVYAASGGAHEASKAGHPNRSIAYYYPGNDYCDIVGMDRYLDNNVLPGYDELSELGKPVACCEFGPKTEDGKFDFSLFLKGLKDKYPKISYCLAWDGNWSIVKNKNARLFMNDPAVITRGKVPSAVVR